MMIGDKVAFDYNESSLKEAVGFGEYINYCIDTISPEETVGINGWVLSFNNQPVSISVVNSSGQEIEYTCKRLRRRDVVEAVFGSTNIEGVDMKPGFYVEFKKEPKEKYTVIFECEGKQARYALEKKQLVKTGKVGKVLQAITFRRIVKGTKYLFKHGPRALVDKAKRSVNHEVASQEYMQFVEKNKLSEETLRRQREKQFKIAPTISIVVPTYKTPEKFLNEMIDSVEAQTYGNYELCIGDGSEDDDSVEKVVRQRMKKNKRILYRRLEKNAGISANTNGAMELATGEYIGLLDHDDLLAPNALFEVVKAMNDDPDCEVFYSDEDKVNMSLDYYFEPHFKPDFSIDFLRSNNYICHFFVAKKSIIDEAGGFDPRYDGSQDHDIILKCVEKAKKVKHIAKILYHWRSHPNSTAQNPESKMYCYEAGRDAVKAHLDRLGIPAAVELGQVYGIYRVTYEVIGHPKVSIIIPNKDHLDDLQPCLQSIFEKTTYDNYEIIVVENNSEDEKTFEYYKEIEKDPRIKVLYWQSEFNYSAINNFGAKEATGEFIVLLNNDTKVLTPNWLEEMIGNCQRTEVGAVGCKLYYPDDTIQHCGVVVGMGGVAGHIFLGEDREYYGYFCRAIVPTDLSACTAACLMVKKSVFDELNGLDEGLKVAFNDVDFCLRIREAGYLIVMDPYVELYHYESKSRGYEDDEKKVARFNSEIEFMETRWKKFFEDGDPYYNPNLSLQSPGFTYKMN